MSAAPDGGMELKIGDDSGVIIRFLELPVPLQQGVKPHEICELPGFGRLPCGFFLEEDPHVIDLDDLLGVYVRDLQASRCPLKEPLVLKPGQRLPDGCPGDAEALGK